MSCFSWPETIIQQYYIDIQCYRFLKKYQRKHVIMCRCGKFPHVLGSTSPGAKIFKYYWDPYCIFCLEREKEYNTALNITDCEEEQEQSTNGEIIYG
jgi:hypothetical protein